MSQTYWLDLFTPKTWAAFQERGCTISGFREGQQRSAQRVKRGDKFLCYVVGLSRWCGILTVASDLFVSDEPYFDDPDPFTYRFEVEPNVALEFEQAVPIFESQLWTRLSLTRDIVGRVPGWAQTANLRASLREIDDADAAIITEALEAQARSPRPCLLDARDRRRIRGRRKVRAADREVFVEVPDDEEEVEILVEQ